MLLSIPFNGVKKWDREFELIQRNWKRLDRRAIISVIKVKSINPQSIKHTCLEIIKDWKNEIKKPIHQFFGPKKYGIHILLSLCNPEIIGLVDKEINEMNEKLEVLPYKLKEAIVKIKAKNEYPVWNFRNVEINQLDT